MRPEIRIFAANNTEYTLFHFVGLDISHYVINEFDGTLHIELNDGTKHVFSSAWLWHITERK